MRVLREVLEVQEVRALPEVQADLEVPEDQAGPVFPEDLEVQAEQDSRCHRGDARSGQGTQGGRGEPQLHPSESARSQQ